MEFEWDEDKAAGDRHGISLAQYALQLENKRRAKQTPRTGAELVAYWRRAGVIGSRPDIVDSSAHARELRRQAERRELS